MSLERTQRRAIARRKLALALLVLKEDPSLNGQPARHALAGNTGSGARRRLAKAEAAIRLEEARVRKAQDTCEFDLIAAFDSITVDHDECEFSEGDL